MSHVYIDRLGAFVRSRFVWDDFNERHKLLLYISRLFNLTTSFQFSNVLQLVLLCRNVISTERPESVS